MLYRGSEQMSAQVLAIADDAKKSCEERREKDCSRAWIDAYFEADKRRYDTPDLLKPGVLEALVPVLVGWLTAYGIVSAVRWVAEGFKLGHSDRTNRGGGAISTMPAAIRMVRYAGVTLLVASGGFLIASWVAHTTGGFKSWGDSLATTSLWNFALAIALYALLAILLVGHGVARLIASRRREQS